MQIPRIVVVGHVCIDHNQSEHATYVGWGSSVLYMTQYLRRAYKIQPIIVTAYGPEMLQHLPAGVSIVPKHPDRPQTLVYENDSSTGKRIQHCRNIDDANEPDITPDVITALKTADIVIIAPLLANYSATFIQKLLNYTPVSTLKVLCPQGYFRHVTTEGLVVPHDFVEVQKIVPQFDLVIYSEEDHPAAFELAQTWKRSMTTAVVVTQSSRGASIITREKSISVPTTPIPPGEIVDSVGCGDTFAATVAYAYWQTPDLEAAILAGHRAAGAKLRTVSSRQAI